MSFKELPFEKPLKEIREKINALQNSTDSNSPATKAKITRLEKKLKIQFENIYKKLAPSDVVKIARHPDRPYTMDYIRNIGDDFIELHGDRRFKDDPAMVGGFITIGPHKLMIIGQEKGRDIDEKLYRNFGSANPEGYRKAIRLMKIAEKFNLPILTFIDTQGAYPGIGAEERGQAEAIAYNLREMFKLKTRTMSIVLGEGGSGGALGIGVTDKIFMLQYATYSVISPEGCASILFRDVKKADISAKALKQTSSDLMGFGIIDGIIPEPPGGAHNDPSEIYSTLKSVIIDEFNKLKKRSVNVLMKKRLNKYRSIGVYSE